eukprot:11884887-Alexandrium_andersonii.AAC.1
MKQVFDVGLEQADRHAASLVAFVHAMLWVVRDAGGPLPMRSSQTLHTRAVLCKADGPAHAINRLLSALVLSLSLIHI